MYILAQDDLIVSIHISCRVLSRSFERLKNYHNISKISKHFIQFVLFSTGKLALVVVILS